MFSSYDLLVVGLYLIILLLIGLKAGHRAGATSFLIAKRKLTTLSAVATINASKTGSIIIIFTALIYAYGVSALWYFVGMSVGYLIFIPFSVRLHKLSDGKYYTLADYFRNNYGSLSSRFAALACIIAMFGSMLLNLVAATQIFVYFSGWPYLSSAALVAAVVLLYLLLAGFKAVVATDLFQYAAILIIICVFLTLLLGESSVEIKEYNIFQAGSQNIIGFFLLGILIPFAQPELWQRVYAVPNRRVLVRSIFISILIHFSFAILLLLIGLSIKSALPNINPDLALVEGFSKLLPAGLIGLSIIVFFSAMMSSVDTYAYTAASSLVQDYFPMLPGERSVLFIRLSLVAIITTGSIVNILYHNLIGLAFILSAYFVLVSLPVLLTWIYPKVSRVIINTALPLSFILITAAVLHAIQNHSVDPSLIIKSIVLSLVSLLLASIICYLKELQKRNHAHHAA